MINHVLVVCFDCVLVFVIMEDTDINSKRLEKYWFEI